MHRPAVIKFSRKLRNIFARDAKNLFPQETFAFCLGKTDRTSATTEILELFFPEIQQHTDGAGFNVYPRAYALAETLAASQGLRVVSTLHSHPYKQKDKTDDCAPSETDWEYLYPDLFMGICSVVEFEKKLTARFKFWPQIRKVKLVC